MDISRFEYNRGLKDYDAGPVKGPDVELYKVTHIDLDNAVLGCERGISFVTPADEGFIYLKEVNDVVKAYKNGALYVVEGSY